MMSDEAQAIAVLGAGVAGLFAARALARAGHAVTVFETDAPAPSIDADDAFQSWQRPGVAQLRQPHAARALLRKLLAERDPALLDAMVDSGMIVWSFHLHGVDDPAIDHDPELIGLLGRRPTLEAPLRRVTEATPNVTIERAQVKGLTFDGEGSARTVTGVVTATGPRRFAAVIDASGRRSKIVEWLTEAGFGPIHEETTECALTYYSRYFRFHPGAQVQRGPYASGPTASLQGVHFTMNRTDRETFSLMLGVAPWSDAFRSLRHDEVFMRFVHRLPGAEAWLSPRISSPIWKVEPFAGLINRYRRFQRDDEPLVQGLYVLGDARFHTNPIHGWGMSFALRMAYLLADVFAEEAEPRERLARFERVADAYARTYYDASAAEDVARRELWQDDAPEPSRGEPGSYRYFLSTIVPATLKDQWIFRKVTRRLHLLDDPTEVLNDGEVLARAARIDATINRLIGAEALRAMAIEATSGVTS